jgi:hypothetical protein
MPKLFGIDIAGIVNEAMGSGLPVVTLVKVTAGVRVDGSLTGGTNPTTNQFPARGFVDDYKDAAIDGTLIKRGDRKVLVLGASIAGSQVPTQGDKLIAESRTYEVVDVKRDPASATYECQCRAI